MSRARRSCASGIRRFSVTTWVDVPLGLAEPCRQLVDRSTLVEQSLIAHRLVERGHVLVMQVGDDHLLLGFVLVDIADANGNGALVDRLGGGQTAPAINQREPLAVRSNEQRFEDPVLADAGRQLLQLLVGETATDVV